MCAGDFCMLFILTICTGCANEKQPPIETSVATQDLSLLQNDTIALSMNSRQANRSMSSTKQLSAWQIWAALACILDSITALYPIRDNPFDLD